MTNGNIEDIKRTLNETILSYGLIISIMLWDIPLNLLKLAGVPILMHEKGIHPFGCGHVQMAMILLVIGLMLWRRIDERRYV